MLFDNSSDEPALIAREENGSLSINNGKLYKAITRDLEAA
jgi:hypothetical protein